MAGKTSFGLGVSNVGAPNTGVTAYEYGTGKSHTTVLVVNQVDALTLADGAAIADGYLLYTFPAGNILINGAMMSMAPTAADSLLQAAATEAGIGSVIASGAVAVLSGTGTFEDVITGQVGVIDGTADAAAVTTARAILTAGAKTIHYNLAMASTVADGADLSCDIAGTVTINWSTM
jgi:hypothetical protein